MENRSLETIAIEMAQYFTSNVSLADLIKWAGLVNYNIAADESISIEQKDNATYITSYLLSNYITSVMDSKAENAIESVSEELINLYSNISENRFKRALQTIGEAFLNFFVNYISDTEEVNEFFKVYHTLMILCVMFRDFELLECEILKKEFKAELS